MRAFLPAIVVIAGIALLVYAFVVYAVTTPARNPYLVTPEKFTQLSGPGLKATEETWNNRDGTRARGWLLRGVEGAPAVILLHRYGTDRSYLLNLGVKLNETTNFTVLWPDLRGHGENPPVRWTSFGTKEAEDTLAAIDYLRSLKTVDRPLVAKEIGLYGVGLGAYAALRAAPSFPSVNALVLDSVPATPDSIIAQATPERTSMDNQVIQAIARTGVRIYLMNSFDNTPACNSASQLPGRRVLLLSSEAAGELRDSTVALIQCFSDQSLVEADTDLQFAGFNLREATGEQSEAYDRRVIDFFDRTLRDVEKQTAAIRD